MEQPRAHLVMAAKSAIIAKEILGRTVLPVVVREIARTVMEAGRVRRVMATLQIVRLVAVMDIVRIVRTTMASVQHVKVRAR